MKISVVFYETENGETKIIKAFANCLKAANFCDKEQRISNDTSNDKSYFFKTIELEE